MSVSKADAFIVHPLVWGVVTLVMAAIALSGRLSIGAAYIVLVFAWALGSFGVWRSGLLHSPALKIGLSVVLGAALILLSLWLRPITDKAEVRSSPPSGTELPPVEKNSPKKETRQSATEIKPQQTVRPYNLEGTRRSRFLELLKAPVGADALRIGCVGWSERACVAAGQFLVLLSQAGWKIEQNKVFRLEPQIPNEGVFIINQPDPGPPLPPHLGRWHRPNLSEMTLFVAFEEMGLPPDTQSDANLGTGITGLYFGPEPAKLEFDKKKVLVLQIELFAKQAAEMQQRTGINNNSDTRTTEEHEWENRVEKWLRKNLTTADLKEFQNSKGLKGKTECLGHFMERMLPKNS